MYRFLVSKLALDDSERVLHFASYRGLSVFNISFPINGVVRYMGQLARTAVDTEIDL